MIKIKVPKSIKVGGFDYSIELQSSARSDLADRHNWGEHSSRLRKMELQSGEAISEQQFSSAFIHELLHACDSIYCQGDISEDTISGLAHGLHQVLEELGIRFIERSNK